MSSIGANPATMNMTSSTFGDELPPLSGEYYALLYGKINGQRQIFLDTKKPASITALLKNKDVLTLFQNNEPGPCTDYNTLRLNLSQLKPNLTGPAGPTVLAFFQKLFKVRANWLVAAVKFETFHAYTRILHDYYVVQRQEMQRAPCNQNVTAYMEYQRECNTFHERVSSGVIEQSFQLLRAAYVDASLTLVDLKKSSDMWHYSGVMWEMIQRYQEELKQRQLQEAAERIRKAQAEKIKERERLKRQNDERRGNQLGSHMVQDMDEAISEMLLNYMQEQVDGRREEKAGAANPK